MKLNETWVIKHKDTGAIWVANSGKSSWRAKGHTKNAWAVNYCESIRRGLVKRFDNQDVYVLVKLLPESEKRLEEAIELLRECVSAGGIPIGSYLSNKLISFLSK